MNVNLLNTLLLKVSLAGLLLPVATSFANTDPPAAEPVATQNPEPQPASPPTNMVPASLIKLGAGGFYSPYAFVVDKSSRTLSVWQQSADDIRLVGAWPTDFGKKPGDKVFDGDLRTPEGVYFFQRKLEGDDLNFNEYGLRAFTMNYPNFFDMRERKTGSGIWLHAIPESKTLSRGSRGCVVVRNEVILKLSEYIRLERTPIVVQDKVNWVSFSKEKTTRKSVLDWLRGWKDSWQGKNLESYIGQYHNEFSSNGMNKEQWQHYKQALNKKYDYIKVDVKQPIIYRHKDEWVVRFLQDYQSDEKADFGEKFLYLKNNAQGHLQIIGETWKAIKKELFALQPEQSI